MRIPIIEHFRAERVVKIECLGAWTPTMEGIFTGDVVNRENIGKTGDQLVERWNELYLHDQME